MTTFKKAAFIAAIPLAFMLSACSDGSDGKNGANGSDGINGANGIDGASCSVFTDETLSHAYSVYCGGSFIGYLDNGAKGDKGETGTTGANGEKGDKGDPGATGAEGAKGDKGETGTTEANGEKGDKGETGATGAEGEKGDKGETGATGAEGAKGDKGETGTKGETGATGPTGAKGADGASCSISESEELGHDYSVYCGGSFIGYLDNGQNGTNGEDGVSCVVSESEGEDLVHGDIKITCGTDVQYIKNGKDGEDGAKGDDGKDGVDGTNGEDGESCFGIDDDDKSIIICGADTVSIIAKFNICNNVLYNKMTDFCGSDNNVYSKCGGETYEASTHFCVSNTLRDKATFSLCNNVLYNKTTDFCGSDNDVYSKCGGESYEVTTHFCDSRNDQKYKYVTIGTQKWMAENLNYNASGSKCYGDLAANCNTYGHFYNWPTAMAGAASSSATPSGVQGICPNGWHLPSDAEWDTLTTYVGGASTAGTKLKSTGGWNAYEEIPLGTDNYGFSALPGGNGAPNGSFSNAGKDGNWWSATERNNDTVYYRYMLYYNQNVGKDYSGKDDRLFSVRCVRD